jgi:hypothetical protein
VPNAAVPSGLNSEILDAVAREHRTAGRVTELSGKRRRPAGAWLAALGAAAALLIGVLIVKGPGASGPTAGFASTDKASSAPHAETGGAGSAGGVVRLDRNYDPSGIERLAATAASGGLPVASAAPAADAAAATQCLTTGAELKGDEQPIQVIEATFQGTPADLGVYRLPGSGGGSDRIVVWVVARKGCSVLSFTQHLIGG